MGMLETVLVVVSIVIIPSNIWAFIHVNSTA